MKATVSIQSFLTALVLLAVAAVSSASSKLSERDQIDIQVAVARAEIAKSEEPGQKAPLAYCLGTMARTDPRSEVIATLSIGPIPFVPISECQKRSTSAPDRKVARFAYVFVTLGEASSQDGIRAMASGSFVAGPLIGAGGVYRLRKKSGGWEVVGYELEWVS